MSKRVSVCIITIAILLIFAVFIYFSAGFDSNNEESQNTESMSEDDDSDQNQKNTDDSKKEKSSYSTVSESGDLVDGSDSLTEASADSSTDEADQTGGFDDSDISASAEISAKYVILARSGSLVVFYADDMTEYFDTGIDVMSLPEETIDQVVKGIYFADEEELFSFLESYSS